LSDTVEVDPEHATTTVVTFAEPIVPEPFERVQVCPGGFVFTVTA
jgi:hypothetical protein